MQRRTVIAALVGATAIVALLLSLLLGAGLQNQGAVADEPPPPPEEESDLPPLPGTPAATPTPSGTPTPSIIEGQLASCAGSYQAVYGFDNVGKSFTRFLPGQPAPISDLTEMRAGAGYMILMSADCLLTYGGNSWQLSSGWNFIGWM